MADGGGAAVLLRGADSATARSHPLNKGVAEDFDDAARLGMISQEARGSGVLYWLGLCQVLMASLLDTPEARPQTRLQIREMMTLGLTGLGVEHDLGALLADRCCLNL